MKTSLQQRNASTQENLNGLNEQIAALQEQIKALTSEVRQRSQQKEAQEQLTTEWKKSLSKVHQLLKDACSVYGDPEVLNDMLGDVQDLSIEVTNNFADYAQSDRYLNVDTADIEDEELNALPATKSEIKQLAAKPLTKKEIKAHWKEQAQLTQAVLRGSAFYNIPEEINNLNAIVNIIYEATADAEAFYNACQEASEMALGITLSQTVDTSEEKE